MCEEVIYRKEIANSSMFQISWKMTPLDGIQSNLTLWKDGRMEG
jgi:hypothetical protein